MYRYVEKIVIGNPSVSAEKRSVIWAKPNTRSLAEQFVRTNHTFGWSLVQWGVCVSVDYYDLFSLSKNIPTVLPKAFKF